MLFRSEIGFTIVSLTISLIAVLIPLLFMGDVVGRLFHEFAITLAVTIVISAIVSLTLVPMMCARILAEHDPTRTHGRVSRWLGWSERLIDRTIDLLEKTRFHVLLLAILDRLEQQILQRHTVEQFAEHVIDTAAQRLARSFQFLQQPRVNLAFARIGQIGRAHV